MAEPRIVSLIASATEIVAALGLADRLVGRSHECDFPSSILSLPVCSAPKIDVHRSSAEIDASVKSLVGDGLSVYQVLTDVLDALEPTHIITQSQCEVCAVSLKDVEAAVGRLVRSRPRIISLSPMDLNDVWEDFRRVGVALGVEQRALSLIAERRTNLDDIERRAAAAAARPTIACIEWIDPIMVAGNWVPELVDVAGGRDLFGQRGKHSPYVEWADFCQADADVIAVMPCGFDIERTREEMPSLVSRPEWNRLSAVRAGRVFLTDGNQYFNRPGPRLTESARILAEMLHPELFFGSMEGIGWVRFIPETSRMDAVSSR